MRDDLEEIRKLESAIALLRGKSTEVYGSVHTIEHLGVSFNVSRRFVVADLSPLTFFHLVEHIGDAGAAAAIVRLYDQLIPLLICKHQWTVLRRTTDKHFQAMVQDQLDGKTYRPHICRSCTAYALSGPLPVIGKTIGND
jgi:hypothetical protein